jgi:carbon monoxide dehydrogenase subunit G
MQLTFTLNQPIDLVFDFLTDPQKFVSVHPLIHRMDHLENNRYLVHETIQVGFIPISFTYPATIDTTNANKTVTMKATVFGLTRITMTFRLTSMSGHTQVEEQIAFSSPLPVKPVLQHIFRKQHEQLFRNIENIAG